MEAEIYFPLFFLLANCDLYIFEPNEIMIPNEIQALINNQTSNWQYDDNTVFHFDFKILK